MSRTWVFDSEGAQRINESRVNFLDKFLQSLPAGLELMTALDAGCGIGFFSHHLASLGLKVTAFDARAENIVEAKRRNSGIEFHVQDVEGPRVQELGKFDLVLCFGLLYHLENPFRAIRNLYALTEKVLLIESMVAPYQLPVAVLVDESEWEDQSLNYVAFYCSEASLAKMLYRAGFTEIYGTTELPHHEDYRETFSGKRRRTILVASKVKLQSTLLQLAPYRRLPPDLWRKPFGRYMYYLGHAFKNPRAALLLARNKLLPVLPLPARLPWGGWWLAWKDMMGAHIWIRDSFEQGEQNFLLRFLEPGMTVLDIGAHQGFYTLLASRKIGMRGQVIAFEPSPRELKRLRWHLTLNRCHNVRVESLALGSAEGTADLFICLGPHTGWNSMRPPAVSDPTRRISVSVVTLDGYLREHDVASVDFVKMDVEGAELEVLKGAAGLVSSGPRPIIMCELHDAHTVPWGYRSSEIYEFLSARGYRWFSVTADGRLQPCPKRESFQQNLFAVPEEKLLPLAAGYDLKKEQIVEGGH